MSHKRLREMQLPLYVLFVPALFSKQRVHVYIFNQLPQLSMTVPGRIRTMSRSAPNRMPMGIERMEGRRAQLFEPTLERQNAEQAVGAHVHEDQRDGERKSVMCGRHQVFVVNRERDARDGVHLTHLWTKVPWIR